MSLCDDSVRQASRRFRTLTVIAQRLKMLKRAYYQLDALGRAELVNEYATTYESGQRKRDIHRRPRSVGVHRPLALTARRFVHGIPKPQPLPEEVWINPPAAATTPTPAQ